MTIEEKANILVNSAWSKTLNTFDRCPNYKPQAAFQWDEEVAEGGYCRCMVIIPTLNRLGLDLEENGNILPSSPGYPLVNELYKNLREIEKQILDLILANPTEALISPSAYVRAKAKENLDG